MDPLLHGGIEQEQRREVDAEDAGALSSDFFFFSSRRRHTRCSRDWSSDVCSSDLEAPGTSMVVKLPLLSRKPCVPVALEYSPTMSPSGLMPLAWVEEAPGTSMVVKPPCDAKPLLTMPMANSRARPKVVTRDVAVMSI